MLPLELDGVTVLIDVPESTVRAGEEGTIVGIRRASDGRLIYTVEVARPDDWGGVAGGELVDLDSTQFGLD